jgi:hypothetical protein
MFLFKRKKVELITYTDNQDLMEMFPLTPAKLMLPEYYKTLEPRISNGPNSIQSLMQPTLRSCYGANTFNRLGFILPLWCDYVFTIKNGNLGLASAAYGNDALNHEHSQYAGAINDHAILKLISPWQFYCKKDIKWLQMQNYYGINGSSWHTPPGIVDFKNQSATHVFLALNNHQASETGEVHLKAGTPIVKYIPLTDDEIVIRREVVDNMEKVTKKSFNYFFYSGMLKMTKAKQETSERFGGKCPFHFNKN